MKALQCDENRKLSLVEKPVPVPTAGLVRIKIGYAGLCHSDQAIISGTIKLKADFPVVLGHEGCGIVDAVGSLEDGEWLGRKVVWETTFTRCGKCDFCLSGEYNLCATRKIIGYNRPGTFSEYLIVPSRNLHAIPSPVPLLDATIMEPLACVVHGLCKTRLWGLIVIAGPGAIGSLAALVLREFKPVLYGLPSSQHRLDVMNSLGIETCTTDSIDRYNEKVDVFIECSGGEGAASTGLRLLKRKGTFLQIGLPQPEMIDWAQIAYKEIRCYGSISSNQDSWELALGLLPSLSTHVHALLSPPYQLEDWEKAFGDAKAGRHIKVIFGIGT